MKHLRLARLFLALCSISATAADETSIVLIDAPDRDFTTAHCAICHSLDYITMNAPVMDRARWQATVQKMIDRFGAPIEAKDVDRLLAYLSQHYVNRE